jgi:hypothetical protein
MAPIAPRPYVIEEYTRTVCPECANAGLRSDDPGVFIDGILVSHDGKIWMRRFCPMHGESESLYEEDAELWRARAGWQTPTLAVTPDRPDNLGGFADGYRDGLPASHGQHSCILVLNITENCNFRCPTCYASALDPGQAAVDRPSLDELLHTVDTVIEREGGRLSVVMLSGGEPTLRRDLEALVLALIDRPITRIMLNTNGRRIERDPDFLAFLASHRDRVEVYLQFDGLTDATYLSLRGEPLAAEKASVLRQLNAAKVFVTLVTTVKAGVNDGELESIFQLGLNTPYCSGIAFQPVFGSGRNSGIDPQNRVTPTGVIRRLGRGEDFVPLPCSHRDCCDIAYFLQDGKGKWRSLVSIIGRDEMKRWIHLAANTIAFENIAESVRAMVKDGTLQGVLSEQQRASSLQLAWDLVKMCDCVPGVRDLFEGWGGRREASQMEQLATRTFRVTVKQFMDAHTFHEACIRQCCVHTGTFEPDPRRYSFCWRWLFEDASDFPDASRGRTSSLPMV